RSLAIRARSGGEHQRLAKDRTRRGRWQTLVRRRGPGYSTSLLGTFMNTTEVAPAITRLFAELVDGASGQSGAFILNSGDAGLLRSLDKLSASEASRSVDDGATIAAHAQHLRYGLSLMNRWATEGGDPFADAMWEEAWKTRDVDAARWSEIRNG